MTGVEEDVVKLIWILFFDVSIKKTNKRAKNCRLDYRSVALGLLSVGIDYTE